MITKLLEQLRDEIGEEKCRSKRVIAQVTRYLNRIHHGLSTESLSRDDAIGALSLAIECCQDELDRLDNLD